MWPLIRIGILGAAALASSCTRAEGDGIHPLLVPKTLPADVAPRVSLGECGGWVNFYGPFDYRSASKDLRSRVESHHFDKYILQYMSWLPNRPFDQYIAANLSYTLRAFPNHPTSLLTMEEIGRRLKTDAIPGSYFPLECWYTRALQLIPADPMVRAHYGIYLAHRGRNAEALANLAIGDKGLCTSRTMQYLIGLAHFKIAAYEQAQKNAMRAERMRFDLPHLKKQLVDSGKWNAALQLPEGGTLDCVIEEPAAAPAVPDEPQK